MEQTECERVHLYGVFLLFLVALNILFYSCALDKKTKKAYRTKSLYMFSSEVVSRTIFELKIFIQFIFIPTLSKEEICMHLK